MKTKTIFQFLPILILLSACTPKAPISPGASTPESPVAQSAREAQDGDTIFDIHSAEYGCGRQKDRVFGCLKLACTSAGGIWDEAGRQCLCDDGVIFVQGARQECQRSHNGSLMPASGLFVIQSSQVGEDRSYVPEFSRTPNVNRLGGTRVYVAPNFGLGWYVSPAEIAFVEMREGYVPNRPQDGDIPLMSVTYVAEKTEDVEASMMRASFSGRDRPDLELGEFSVPLHFVTTVLDQYAGLQALPQPKVQFRSRSGGCAAGCRLEFDLSAPTGYSARLIRDYMWGSIGFEAVEIKGAQGEEVQVILYPSGRVSHLQGPSIRRLGSNRFPFPMTANGQIIGNIPGGIAYDGEY